MGPKSNAQPKPYINSALQLDKKKFSYLKDVDALLKLLASSEKERKETSATNTEDKKPPPVIFIMVI
jgi:hypothetical protein